MCKRISVGALIITFGTLLIIGSTFPSAFAQGGGGEKIPEAPKPTKTVPRETSAPKPPAISRPAPPPALSALVVNGNLPGAAVTVNGRVVGTTDSSNSVFIGSLKPGNYTVTTTKPGYHQEKQTGRVLAGQTETVNFNLRPILQFLTIHSIPGESEVTVDDVASGRTDSSGAMKLEVPIGLRRITVRKPRYREFQHEVALSEERAAEVKAELQLAVGVLSVTSNVRDSAIEISGVGRFKGSVDKIDCEPGTYSISASRPLFQTANKQVSIRAGEDLNISLELEPDTVLRSSLLAEAQQAYSRANYARAIETAGKLLSADPTHAEALRVVSQSAFIRDDLAAFADYGRRTIDSGATIEIQVRHHHAFFGTSSLHFVKLAVGADTISFDPQRSAIKEGGCPNPPFSVNLQRLLTAEASRNADGEVYLRLVFSESADGKKTSTLKFADRESRAVRTRKTKSAGGIIGITYETDLTVSRSKALDAMGAIATLLNHAKSKSAGTMTSKRGAPEVVYSETAEPGPALEAIIESAITAAGGPPTWVTTVQTGTYTWTDTTSGLTLSGSFEEYIKGREAFFHTFNHDTTGFFLQEGFDGQTGWFRLYKQKPKQMEPASVANLKRGLRMSALKDVEDFKQAYPVSVSKGRARLGETDVYVVQAGFPLEGRSYTLYFSTQTGLLIRMDSTYDDANQKGKKISTQFLIEEYGDIDGRKVVTAWKQITPSLVLAVKISATQHDVPVDEAKFKMPAK